MDADIKVVHERRQCVVVGGGSAGWVSAVAAARNGCKVLLAERYGFLGGTASGVMLPAFGGIYTAARKSEGQPIGIPDGPLDARKQHLFGIPTELLGRLNELSLSEGLDLDNWVNGGCPYDKEMLKHVAARMVVESGAEVLLHARFVDAVVDGDRVDGVVLAAKDGLHYVPADVVIDCTGDGDVFAAAGASFAKGGPAGQLQPSTMMFKLGNVDFDAVMDYVREHPEECGYTRSGARYAPDAKPVTLSGFYTQVAAAVKAGEYSPNMNSLAMHFTLRRGEVIMNMLHSVDVDGTDPWSLTRSEMEGREQTFRALSMLRRRIPGFSDAYLIETGVQAGTRESRRLIGEYVLTRDDVLSGATFEDGILRNTGSLSYHDPKGKKQTTVTRLKSPYEVPYRCLVSCDRDALLVAGRCISADHEGFSTVRSAGAALSLGEVAGTAAALSVASGVQPRNLDVSRLRAQLIEQSAREELAVA